MGRVFAGFLMMGLASTLGAQATFKVAVPEGAEAYIPMVTAIYRELSMVPSFVVVPSERALVGLESGEYDADIGRASTSLAWLRNAAPTMEPLLEVNLLAVTKPGVLTTPLTLPTLSRHTLVTMRGNRLAESVLQPLGLKFDAVSDMPTVAKMVSSGRVEVGLINSVIPLSSAGEAGKGLETQKEPLASAKLMHVFGKAHADLVPRWDAVVRTLRANGRLKALVDQAMATFLK